MFLSAREPRDSEPRLDASRLLLTDAVKEQSCSIGTTGNYPAPWMLNQSYPAAYEILLQEKPTTCATTRTKFESVPAPAAVILDVRVSSSNKKRALTCS